MTARSELVESLTDEDRSALRAYASYVAPHRAAVTSQVRVAPRVPAGFTQVVALHDDPLQWELERPAIFEQRWAPYLEALNAHGVAAARAGIPYAAWFRLGNLVRDHYFEILLAAPLPTPDGTAQVARGVHLALDIRLSTVARSYFDEKERQVRSQEHQFRAIFRDNPIPMWTRDVATQRMVDVNEAALRIYGYDRDALLAMSVADLELETAAPLQPHRHRHKNGSTILVEQTLTELHNGESTLQLVSAIDVTERERTREALQQSEEMLQQSQKMDALGRLAGGIAHDFNNILTVIQTCAGMLEDCLDVGDERRQDATEIRMAAVRATKMTNQLLTLSRQSGSALRTLSLDELVAGFVPTLQRLLGSSVKLDIRAGGVPPVVADPGQLEQVVMNLAVNARDAMAGKGRVTIETSVVELDAEAAALHRLVPGRYAVLAVTDTGPGIPPEIQKRMFDPFFTTKAPGKGTGLGLSIAHGIVTQAGGTIDIYSELGRGTTFRIRLPTTTAAVDPTAIEPAPAPRELRPVTVLFVDPEPEMRAVVARVLHAAGCTVVVAATAAEARDICVSHDGVIHVVVVELALPDGRGDLLMHVLRELRPALRFILMSGFPSGVLGPSGDVPPLLLAKPFTPSQLRDAIASVTSEPDLLRRSEPSLRSRVLVVDDDPDLRRMLTRLLVRAGFEVTDVDSGRAALAALEARRFEVVLSDIHMPGGGGLELLRSVRRVDLDIPVILMSGRPDVATAATALEFGAFRYLTKPLGTEEVEKVVRNAARANALARIRREAVVVGGGHAGIADRAGLEVRFEQAVENLWIAYQPIIESRSGALFGVEALMRSREPSLPTPTAMLDAASQLGRLPLLGRRIRALAARPLVDRPDVPTLFVNLHPDDLRDIDLVDEGALLTKLASRVVLEITERESLITSPELIKRLDRLRELGFRLAVDDIGAGYSGLTSFADLMPEIVKIDMSLVRAIHTSKVKQRTVRALCALCHEMGALVVGEGVETVDERDCVIELGCDLLQGYLLAKPSAELPCN